MERRRQRPVGLLVRLVIYTLAVAAAFLIRGNIDERGTGLRFPTDSDLTTAITVTGEDLAPDLIPRLVSGYKRRFPAHEVTLVSGGSAYGLQALADERAQMAMLYRPPTAEEQSLLREAVNDTAVYYPFALAAIDVVAGRESPVDSLRMETLRNFVRGERSGFERLYVTDPNQGLWDAFVIRLGTRGSGEYGDRVVYLKDERAVLQAVAADAAGLGLVSSLRFPEQQADSLGIWFVPVQSDTAKTASQPLYAAVAYGDYPLYHFVYAACLENGAVLAAMLVTDFISDRGQRAVERAGVLPSRQVMREIHLTRKAPGPARPSTR